MMLLKDQLGMYHPLSFAEDDKLRPGEGCNVQQTLQNFFQEAESVRVKMADLPGL